MLTSQLITGWFLIVLSICLIILGFFTLFVSWIYGIPMLIIGIFILLNKNEDEIEQVKGGNKK